MSVCHKLRDVIYGRPLCKVRRFLFDINASFDKQAFEDVA